MSFGCHCFDQKANEIFLRISALASNKRLNQKLYLKNYVKYPLISVPSNVEVASQSYICCSLVYNALHCKGSFTNYVYKRRRVGGQKIRHCVNFYTIENVNGGG